MNTITVTSIREYDVYYTFRLTDQELADALEELGYTVEELLGNELSLADRAAIFEHLYEVHDYEEELNEAYDKITDVIVEAD